ncbi:MAG: hypothetical protein QCI38_04185 [Candidatus Thermoplasmatota archaeon]|nr:hypothetical protein [Candidatus Thermoplasmatota archaeon]
MSVVMSDDGWDALMRTRRYLPKRQVETQGLFELDSTTLDWMKTHHVSDITGMAISKVAEGNDPSKEIGLVNELTEIAWKTGISIEREHNREQLEALEYYQNNEKITA